MKSPLRTFTSGALHRAVGTVMIAAAERAILPRYRQLGRTDILQKAIGEPVTIADRESEAILSEGLAKLLPEAKIVGEEAADANPALLRMLGEELCWIIDPLDGTGNFVSGEGPFGILVALAERGVAIGGWIYDPLSKRTVAAFQGEGTMINGAPVRSNGSKATPRTAAISALIPPELRLQLQTSLGPHFQAVTIPRCAAEQYPRVILGINDLTFFERTLAWDHAAGVLCLSEAGGVATRLDGSPYRVDDDRTGLLAAASPALWEEAIGYIRQH